MRKGFLIVLSALLLSGNYLAAQSVPFDPEIRKLYLNLDTLGGNRLLIQRYKVNSPDFIRLLSYREFLISLLHQSKKNVEQYLTESGPWIQSLDRLHDAGISIQVALAEIHLYRSVLTSQISDYKTTATELIASYKIVARFGSDFTTSDRNKLSGFLGIIFHQVPDQYVKYLKLLGVRTSGLSGFNGLERYYGSALPGTADRMEGFLLLVTTLKEFSQDPAASWNFVTAEGMPMFENPLVRYQCAMAALKAGNCDKAVELLEIPLPAKAQVTFPYWNYLLGRTKLYQDNPESVICFDRFLQDPGGENYRHSATLLAAEYYFIHGKQDQANKYLEKMKNFSAPLTVADKQALIESSAEKLPKSYLLKIRFLFDGGYYNDCLTTCESMLLAGGYSGPEDGELLYRKARCQQRLGRVLPAIETYKEVIGRAEKINSYFVPNSALQVGYLYKKSGQTELARKYYHICLDLNNYGYREGINSQAQAALRELDK